MNHCQHNITPPSRTRRRPIRTRTNSNFVSSGSLSAGNNLMSSADQIAASLFNQLKYSGFQLTSQFNNSVPSEVVTSSFSNVLNNTAVPEVTHLKISLPCITSRSSTDQHVNFSSAVTSSSAATLSPQNFRCATDNSRTNSQPINHNSRLPYVSEQNTAINPSRHVSLQPPLVSDPNLQFPANESLGTPLNI